MILAEDRQPYSLEDFAPGAPKRTFRDPAGSVEIRPDGVFRFVNPPGHAEFLEFLSSPLAAALVEHGRLVDSEVVSHPDAGGEAPLVLRHPRISFVSYPWEWPPALWLSAAELTLDLCSELVKEGWILKDATPLNVLFQGTRPILVDVLSIERLDLGKPLWYAYGQFVRTFLLPLVAYSQLGWPLHTMLMRRDGFEPEEIYAALPWQRRLRSPSLLSVTLPTLLAKTSLTSSTGKTDAAAGDPEITKQVITRTLAGLRKAIRQAMPVARASVWSDYAETGVQHYSSEDHSGKREFVRSVLAECNPARVLDVGCNTGVYSRLAAETGAEIVSVDADVQAVDRLANQLAKDESGANILPLCIDFAHATPAAGWENGETSSFLERASGHFDTVLMLAVIHHLLLSAQIPLGHIASLCSRITTRNLIIEWAQPSDPKFIEVLRGRDALYGHLTEQAFRTAFSHYFDIARETTLANERILFHLVRKV